MDGGASPASARRRRSRFFFFFLRGPPPLPCLQLLPALFHPSQRPVATNPWQEADKDAMLTPLPSSDAARPRMDLGRDMSLLAVGDGRALGSCLA